MFRLLLKLLGLEQYEYPELDISTLQKTSPHESVVVSKTELKPEPELINNSKLNLEGKKRKYPTISKPEDVLLATYIGLKSHYAKVLIEAGFDSADKIKQASDTELLTLKGIGKATLSLLRK